MLGTEKWNIKKNNASGLMRNNKNNLIVPTTKNKLLTILTKSGKVVTEISLPDETKEATITDLIIIGKNIIVGFSNGTVYEIKANQKPKEIFRSGISAIVSLNNVDGNCLVTDYNGNITLLRISE